MPLALCCSLVIHVSAGNADFISMKQLGRPKRLSDSYKADVRPGHPQSILGNSGCCHQLNTFKKLRWGPVLKNKGTWARTSAKDTFPFLLLLLSFLSKPHSNHEHTDPNCVQPERSESGLVTGYMALGLTLLRLSLNST